MKRSLLKKVFSLTIAVATATVCCVCAAESSEAINPAGMGEEEGTAAEAIEIGTAEELAAFAQSVTDGSMGGYAGQTVVLTADID